MNDRIKAKISISLFLAFILIAGTITALSPSFIIGVNAQPYYGLDNRYGPTQYPDNNYHNSYESDYGMDNNNDRKSYGNDNNYKSEKDSSNKKSVSINKIKCINTNLNINGNNAGNISIGNKGQGYLGAGSSSGEGYNNKQDKGFDCKINNNNTNTNSVSGGNQTIPSTAILNVTKGVTCQFTGSGPSDNPCPQVQSLITEDQFDIEVTGNNPVPSQFPGSQSGTVVTLGPGNYIVSETPDESVEADLNTLRTQLGTSFTVTGPFPSFTGDCTQNPNLVFEATGTIEAEESQSCIIENLVRTSNL